VTGKSKHVFQNCFKKFSSEKKIQGFFPSTVNKRRLAHRNLRTRTRMFAFKTRGASATGSDKKMLCSWHQNKKASSVRLVTSLMERKSLESLGDKKEKNPSMFAPVHRPVF
jgi:hypothetical protein